MVLGGPNLIKTMSLHSSQVVTIYLNANNSVLVQMGLMEAQMKGIVLTQISDYVCIPMKLLQRLFSQSIDLLLFAVINFPQFVSTLFSFFSICAFIIHFL